MHEESVEVGGSILYPCKHELETESEEAGPEPHCRRGGGLMVSEECILFFELTSRASG